MKLERLEIRNFGKLQNRSLEFTDGINLIVGGNESGKSTVHTFVRSMLFGMRRGRGRASEKDMFRRYEPWDNPSFYAGAMEFESGGKGFRLTRNFARGGQDDQLVCTSDGEIFSLEDDDLGMLLGGISETTYDNTVSVGQLRSRTDEGLVSELRNYMANYQGSSDGELNVDAALEYLKRKKRELEKESRELREEQEKKKLEFMTRVRILEEETDRARERIRELQGHDVPGNPENRRRDMESPGKDWSDNQRSVRESPERKCSAGIRSDKEYLRKEYPDKECSETEVENEECIRFGKGSQDDGHSRLVRRLRIGGIAALLLGIVGAAGAIKGFFGGGTSVLLQVVFLLCMVISAAAYVWIFSRLMRKSGEEQTELPEQEHRKAQLEKLRYLESELYEKQVACENMRQEYEEYCIALSEKDSNSGKIEAIELAAETIRSLSEKMQDRIGERLKRRMSDILCELTDGAYLRVTMDEKLQIRLYDGKQSISVERVSRGTVEQAYFALRMGAMDILCEEELPVLLDEPFVLYDEGRMKRALRWLLENHGQVLLFTCRENEERALKEMGLPYHKIVL